MRTLNSDNRLLAILALTGVLVCAAIGCRGKKAEQVDEFGEQKKYAQLTLAMEKELHAQFEVQAVRDSDEQQAIDSEVARIREQYAKQFERLAVQSEDRAVAALSLAQIIRLSGTAKAASSIDQLLAEHADSDVFDQEIIREILVREQGVQDVERILQQNQRPRVLAMTRYELAQHLLRLLSIREQVRSQDRPDKQALTQIETRMNGQTDSQLRSRALDLLREVAEADQSWVDSDGNSLAASASAMVFSLEHLQVNQPAPELSGNGVGGAPIRLSDFRGRKVLVTFWGKWCGPCRALMQIEKKLADKYSRDRLQMLGVNSDTDPEDAEHYLKTNQITWPNILDGGTEGPLACQWEIDQWPMVFLIDEKGIIRFRQAGRANVERAVEALLAE